MRPILDVARDLGIIDDHLEPFGRDKAKVRLEALDRANAAPGKLVLVSAITPTPAGKGKTTMSIGLAQGCASSANARSLALRQPSMGPVFGRKGSARPAAARSRLEPSETINLQFTGDFHAITAAHNLLAAAIDNRLHFGDPDLDPRRILWKRVLDVNDRALRRIVIGLGGPSQGVPRESGFDITAASEVMAILCLADSPKDLRTRLNRMLVGYSKTGAPILAESLKVIGSMAAILREAIMPNLVQSREGAPAFVHGGPFANIAHGCNSILATKMALSFGDYAITEAGFAFDLGAEKFLDIKCRVAGFNPAAFVLVATIRALKMHGGSALEELTVPDPVAVEKGLENLAAHLDAASKFGKPTIVAINKFTNDTNEELEAVHKFCRSRGVASSTADVFGQGGGGDRIGGKSRRRLRPPRDPLSTALSPRLVDRKENRNDRRPNVWGFGREHSRRRSSEDSQGQETRLRELADLHGEDAGFPLRQPQAPRPTARFHDRRSRYRDRRGGGVFGRAHRRDRADARPSRTRRRRANRRRFVQSNYGIELILL